MPLAIGQCPSLISDTLHHSKQVISPVRCPHACACRARLLAPAHPLARAHHCRPTAATAPAVVQHHGNAPGLSDNGNGTETTPRQHGFQIRSLTHPTRVIPGLQLLARSMADVSVPNSHALVPSRSDHLEACVYIGSCLNVHCPPPYRPHFLLSVSHHRPLFSPPQLDVDGSLWPLSSFGNRP
jgi:hypothetical protein